MGFFSFLKRTNPNPKAQERTNAQTKKFQITRFMQF